MAMQRASIADRIATIAPLSPRPSVASVAQTTKLGSEALIVLQGEAEGVAAVASVARHAQLRVASLGEPVVADAKLATGKVGAMATILELGGFYDQSTLEDVRGFHGSEHARIDGEGRGALARAALIFAHATRVLLRIVAGTFLPGVVRAGTDAALAQRPAYDKVAAGIHAATAELASAVERVPTAPTVSGNV